MSANFIDDFANQILDVAGSEEEVCALIDNILLRLKEIVGGESSDDEYTPTSKDLKLEYKDARDDENLEPEVECEDLEVVKDAEGFICLT